MKLKTFAKRAAAAGAVLAALVLTAVPALAAPSVQVDTSNAVADHADILSTDTENYVNEISVELSDACGAQIGVYTVEEMLGNTTMEGFAYNVFNAWELGSADQDNGVLLLLAPYEADGGDYYIMRGTGLESRLSISTLGALLDEYMEPYWATGDYDTGTQKTVEALADRLCSIYGVTLSDGSSSSTSARGGPNIMEWILIIFAVILVIWIISVLLRPRGPRPPRGGGYGGGPANNMFWYGMGRASRRPRRPPPPPPPPRGPGYGPGPGFGGGPRPGSGPRPGGGPRPSGGGFQSGGGFSSGGGVGRSRPSGGSFGGSRPSGGGFRSGGGSTRGGGVGRHH